MISVEEAKSLINTHTKPLDAKRVKLNEASGHVLASPVFAFCDIPSFRQSSMDGYAIRFADINKELILKGEMAAGSKQTFNIGVAECARIFTGAPLPDGADTVVMQEKIVRKEARICIADAKLALGSNVRDKGAEVKTAELAMEKGNYLSPPAIGFLAGIGIDEVHIYSKPAVALIITGKELQRPGVPLEFGQVYDSNSYSLTAALELEGIKHINIVEADDELEVLTDVLREQLATCDVVLLTGGISVGDYDFVLKATQLCGVEQIFHKVKQKPGKPLYFGKHGNKLVFGLPGNPSSVLSCFYNYVLPAIRLLSGRKVSSDQLKATLTNAYSKPAGLTHFLKGSYTNGQATPLNAQESYRLSSFANSNCLICLPENQQHFEAGDSVELILLPD